MIVSHFLLTILQSKQVPLPQFLSYQKVEENDKMAGSQQGVGVYLFQVIYLLPVRN